MGPQQRYRGACSRQRQQVLFSAASDESVDHQRRGSGYGEHHLIDGGNDGRAVDALGRHPTDSSRQPPPCLSRRVPFVLARRRGEAAELDNLA